MIPILITASPPDSVAAAPQDATSLDPDIASSVRGSLGGWRTSVVKQEPASSMASPGRLRPHVSTRAGMPVKSATPSSQRAQSNPPRIKSPAVTRSSIKRTLPTKASANDSTGTPLSQDSKTSTQLRVGSGATDKFCVFCGATSHVVAADAATTSSGHRTVMCPWLGSTQDDVTVSLADVVDDSGNAAADKWKDWVDENMKLGVGRDVILAILAENRLRPRAAVALYGPQSDMLHRAAMRASATPK